MIFLCKIWTIFKPILLGLFAIILVFSPSATFNGAAEGLKLWALTLVPSLFPFIVLANLLLNTNFIHIFGRLLNPVMRPLFHLSGNCAFAVALGFTSGFPMGAVTSVSLYEQQLCTKKEAERLLAFTNNSSPLFLLAAVPISMLSSPQIGLILLISHYGANFILGVFLGFMARFKGEQPLDLSHIAPLSNLSFLQAFTQSVTQGIKSILTIGGFVVFFSVIISLAERTGLFRACITLLLQIYPFDSLALKGMLYGIFEMTLSAQTISESDLSLLHKALLISFSLAFSGLCIHAQVISIAKKLSPKLYLLCRPLQGLLAMGILYLLWPYQRILSVFSPLLPVVHPNSITSVLLLFFILLSLLFLSTIIYLVIIGAMRRFPKE